MCGVCVASSVNQIGAEGAKGLAEGLSSNSTLQTLHLQCMYGGRGAGRGVGRRGSGRDGEGSGNAGKGQGRDREGREHESQGQRRDGRALTCVWSVCGIFRERDRR